MKKLSLFLFLLGLFHYSNAQFFIYQAQSEKPLSYANVYVQQNDSITFGTYSDSTGQVWIPGDLKKGSVIISHLSIKDISLRLPIRSDTLFLDFDSEELGEVTVVKSRKTKKISMGHSPKLIKHNIQTVNGSEIISYFQNRVGEPIHIDNFKFYIDKRDNFNSAHLKVIFYSNDNGKPGKKMPVEKVMELTTDTDETVKISLTALNIIIPNEGMFIGLEWMGCISTQVTLNKMNFEDCSYRLVFYSTSSEAEGYFRINKTRDWEHLREQYSYLSNGKMILPAFKIYGHH